jgi:hypothetical protein
MPRKSDVYDGLSGVATSSIPRFPLISSPSPATASCDTPRKKLKITDAVCDPVADADF